MNTPLSKTKLRPFTLEDAPEVVDLMNARSQAILGVKAYDLAEMIEDWISPGLDLKKATRVLEDEQGTIIGYVEVWDINPPHVIKYVSAIMDPAQWDDDCYRYMLRWAEECACERIPLAPTGARVVINDGTSSKDTRRKKALEDYGYKLVRHFYRMVIELDQGPSAPVLPDGLTITPIQIETELRDVVVAMEDGFADHWGHVQRSVEDLLEQWDHHIANSADFDPTLWFLAKDGDEIAGICRCTNKIPEDPTMGWVNQLCVRKPWRRRGLGMTLLLTAFNELYRRGKPKVGLAVDAASLTNATRLYEKAGMHVTQQYDTYEMELRPGKDLAKK